MNKNEIPLYPISSVAELLEVHPETIRIWEKHGIIKPQRKGGKRFYTETDLKRLIFIKKLLDDHLNLPAIRHYLKLYPCWYMQDCPRCMRSSKYGICSKPCWKEEGTFCQVSADQNSCANCGICSQKP
ncbi:MAG: MerR family transcriptional regulator [Dehalococcoidales bacterium]|jgi:hypothetical protein|nr:MerR family transcriptional regulator [Dehalococcoidales bacterium]